MMIFIDDTSACTCSRTKGTECQKKPEGIILWAWLLLKSPNICSRQYQSKIQFLFPFESRHKVKQVLAKTFPCSFKTVLKDRNIAGNEHAFCTTNGPIIQTSGCTRPRQACRKVGAFYLVLAVIGRPTQVGVGEGEGEGLNERTEQRGDGAGRLGMKWGGIGCTHAHHIQPHFPGLTHLH